jgi:hypothetical protein
MDSDMMMSLAKHTGTALAVALLAYLLLSPPGRLGSDWVLGGSSYGKYLQPLLLGALAALVCWGMDKL